MRIRLGHVWAPIQSFGIAMGLGLAASSSPGAAVPTSLQSIAAAYQGSWQAHFVSYQTPYSKASGTDEHIANDCRASASEALCVQSVDGKPSAELHFTATGQPGSFATRTVGPDRASAIGSLFIAGNRWIYPWRERHDGREIMFRVVNRFVTPNRILFVREYRAERGTWHQMAVGREEREGARQPAIPGAAAALPAAGIYRVGTRGKLSSTSMRP